MTDYYSFFSTPSIVPELTRAVSREEYEADRLANPFYEDGERKATWEELQAVKVEATLGEWHGMTIKA